MELFLGFPYLLFFNPLVYDIISGFPNWMKRIPLRSFALHLLFPLDQLSTLGSMSLPLSSNSYSPNIPFLIDWKNSFTAW